MAADGDRAIEVGGALGVLAGGCHPLVRRAAAALLGATMTGAIGTHLRLGDPPKHLVPAASLLALAVLVARRTTV